MRTTEREGAEKDADCDPENGELSSKLAAAHECERNHCSEVPRGKLHAGTLRRINGRNWLAGRLTQGQEARCDDVG
jgi:hypothetical protein